MRGRFLAAISIACFLPTAAMPIASWLQRFRSLVFCFAYCSDADRFLFAAISIACFFASCSDADRFHILVCSHQRCRSLVVSIFHTICERALAIASDFDCCPVTYCINSDADRSLPRHTNLEHVCCFFGVLKPPCSKGTW